MAGPKGRPRLATALAPGRFAQGMAGTVMLGTGLSLLAGWRALAFGLEVLLLAALGALVLGRFCLGSYPYLIVTGQTALAHRTLPWARDG